MGIRIRPVIIFLCVAISGCANLQGLSRDPDIERLKAEVERSKAQATRAQEAAIEARDVLARLRSGPGAGWETTDPLLGYGVHAAEDRARSLTELAGALSTEAAMRAAGAAEIVRAKSSGGEGRKSWLRGGLSRPDDGGFDTVDVLFGTDRRLDDAAVVPAQRFSGLRGPRTPTLGVVSVSVPHNHKLGRVERPKWYQLAADPSEHMMMQDPKLLQPEAFFARARAAASELRRPKMFIFVHGYNVSFEDAALRTAQMAVDLELDAVPTFYSWPSVGGLRDYAIDDGNATWAIPNFRSFLEQLAAATPGVEIVVIAHSMGTRVTTAALRELLNDRPQLRNRFKEVILAAPDIDAADFRDELMPALARFGQRVTMYASSRDKALEASHYVREYPRAGDTKGGVILVPGLETIDASAVDTDFLGHSYFVQERPLLTDLNLLITHGEGADERPGLAPVRVGSQKYWRFRE